MSIDVDVLDYIYMPCTGTIVDKGISIESLLHIINWVKKQGNVISTDLVEFNININNTRLYYATNICKQILQHVII